MRLLSLCSGIGCIDIAAQHCNIEIAGQVECDPFCQQVLAKHWPNVKRMSDIKDVIGDEFGTIDIVAGGIPCQPFSQAGQRRGTTDDRHLWPYAFSIIKVAQPTWILIENVTGFIDLALDLVATDLESEGYEVQAFVLPAAAVEAPHQRERIFILAYTQRMHSIERTFTAMQRRWQDKTEQVGMGCCNVADTYSIRESREESPFSHWQCSAIEPTSIRQRKDNQRNRDFQSDTRLSQSRMGRDADGSTGWLDRHQWPALPGQEQFPYEPARTISKRQPNQRKRLKALGNAVVPQQIYPFFKFMVEAN